MKDKSILIDMLKERKVWWTIRKLEIRTGKSPVSKAAVIHETLLKNRHALPILTFKDEDEVRRTIDSLVGSKHVWHEKYVNENTITGNAEVIQGIKTEANADNFYSGTRFWKKWVDEVGIILILGTIATILSFVPNGVAYKALEIFELLLNKI